MRRVLLPVAVLALTISLAACNQNAPQSSAPAPVTEAATATDPNVATTPTANPATATTAPATEPPLPEAVAQNWKEAATPSGFKVAWPDPADKLAPATCPNGSSCLKFDTADERYRLSWLKAASSAEEIARTTYKSDKVSFFPATVSGADSAARITGTINIDGKERHVEALVVVAKGEAVLAAHSVPVGSEATYAGQRGFFIRSVGIAPQTATPAATPTPTPATP
jgi:predicted small lipoprotein YifL